MEEKMSTVRALATSPDATDDAFTAQYPKLSEMLVRARDQDPETRERTIALAEQLLELSKTKATNEAGLAIFEACAPDSVKQKLRAAIDLRSRDARVAQAQDSQVEQLAAQLRAREARQGPAGP
jgi:hypothetical protein